MQRHPTVGSERLGRGKRELAGRWRVGGRVEGSRGWSREEAEKRWRGEKVEEVCESELHKG